MSVGLKERGRPSTESKDGTTSHSTLYLFTNTEPPPWPARGVAKDTDKDVSEKGMKFPRADSVMDGCKRGTQSSRLFYGSK